MNLFLIILCCVVLFYLFFRFDFVVNRFKENIDYSQSKESDNPKAEENLKK